MRVCEAIALALAATVTERPAALTGPFRKGRGPGRPPCGVASSRLPGGDPPFPLFLEAYSTVDTLVSQRSTDTFGQRMHAPGRHGPARKSGKVAPSHRRPEKGTRRKTKRGKWGAREIPSTHAHSQPGSWACLRPCAVQQPHLSVCTA